MRELRTAQCDVAAVVAAAAWVAGERERHFAALPAPAWATLEEIAADRGVPVTLVDELVDQALRRDLLAAESGRGVSVTAAGHEHTAQAMRP